MKAFLVGFAAGATAAIGACLHMAGKPDMKIILLAAAPHILVAIAVAALIVIIVPLVQLLKNRNTADRIIESAERQAATILADAEKTRLATAQQVALLKARQAELEQMYRGKREKWLAELVNLRQKNKDLGETVAVLKVALKRKKKSHYRNVAAAAGREEFKKA